MEKIWKIRFFILIGILVSLSTPVLSQEQKTFLIDIDADSNKEVIKIFIHKNGLISQIIISKNKKIILRINKHIIYTKDWTINLQRIYGNYISGFKLASKISEVEHTKKEYLKNAQLGNDLFKDTIITYGMKYLAFQIILVNKKFLKSSFVDDADYSFMIIFSHNRRNKKHWLTFSRFPPPFLYNPNQYLKKLLTK